MQNNDIAYGDRIRQAIDIVLKTALRSVGMISYGRSPRAFYFPEEKQLNILGEQLKKTFMLDVSQRDTHFLQLLFVSNQHKKVTRTIVCAFSYKYFHTQIGTYICSIFRFGKFYENL